MKIAHVSATFPPYQGGTGNVCYHNARQLARLGHEVHVFTASHDKIEKREQRNGLLIHRLCPLIRVGNAPLLPQLLWKLRGFDLIHLHYPFFGGEMTTVAAKASGTPLVVTYHQDVLLSGIMNITANLLRHTVGRLTLRTAKRLLFTSIDYAQASYVRPMLSGREQAIGELSNGVDITRFTPDKPSSKVAKGYQKGDQIALLVAALDQSHYFKGVNVFLEALARLPSHIKGIIVGDGDLRASYEASAKSLGLLGRVRFAGRVSQADLVDFYRFTDVTVLPSVTMGEAFGLVLLESLACETPVIASNLPGVRTVVADGRDGFLVEPGNINHLASKLQTILTYPASQRQQMGITGRRKVQEQYTWERIGVRLEQMYWQIVERPAMQLMKQKSEI